MCKYFKQEAKEKKKIDALEIGIERFGPNYKPSECAIM
jgi:hypothetical protein